MKVSIRPLAVILNIILCLSILCSGVARHARAEPPSKESEIDKVSELFGPTEGDDKASQTETKKEDKEGSKEKGDKKEQGQADAKEEKAADEEAVAVEDLDVVEGQAMALINGMLPVETKIANAMKVESAFLRRACKLTEEQEEHIAKLDKKWITKNVRIAGNQMVNGVMVFAGNGNVASAGTVRKAVSKALTKELANVLTDEQKAEYARETEIRDAFERDARADAMLLMLDEKLFLRDDQLDALRKVLAKVAIADMDPINYIMNPQYLPTLPDASIIKHLDAEQKRVYMGIQKVTFGTSEQDLPVIDR